MRVYQISINKMTCMVTLDKGIVVDAAPILSKFIGQPFSNLQKWMKKQTGYEVRFLNGKT